MYDENGNSLNLMVDLKLSKFSSEDMIQVICLTLICT